MQDSYIDNRNFVSASAESVKRYLLAALGVLFVGIGAVGVVLPGIPTVGPLLIASFLFTKSCPWLEQKLIRNQFFSKFLPYLDGRAAMSVRAKLTTIAIMWTSIGASVMTYRLSQVDAVWFTPVMLLAGLIGTIFISKYGRKNLTADRPEGETE